MPKRALGWKEIQGDTSAALDWPIDEDSIVVEIGGYEGRWASQMADKFKCHIHVFEPQDWAMEKAITKLTPYDNIYFHEYGLWTHTALMTLGDYGRDGASLLKPKHEDSKQVLVEDIDAVFQIMGEELHDDKDIDVCLMNIEGGEYVLIPYMIGMGIMKRIKFFWAQFHMFVPNSERKFEAINKEMETTHDVLWDFGMSMKCWKRRDA